jgi:hypothetical protein
MNLKSVFLLINVTGVYIINKTILQGITKSTPTWYKGTTYETISKIHFRLKQKSQ